MLILAALVLQPQEQEVPPAQSAKCLKKIVITTNSFTLMILFHFTAGQSQQCVDVPPW